MKKNNDIRRLILEQYSGVDDFRKEYLLLKKKDHFVYEDHWINESICERRAYDEISFPSNMEVIKVTRADENGIWEYSITIFKGGEWKKICELSDYSLNITAEEEKSFFKRFNRKIEEFKKKGYEEKTF